MYIHKSILYRVSFSIIPRIRGLIIDSHGRPDGEIVSLGGTDTQPIIILISPLATIR